MGTESQPLWEFALFYRSFEIFLGAPKLHSGFTGGSFSLSAGVKAHLSLQVASCLTPDLHPQIARIGCIDDVLMMIPFS